MICIFLSAGQLRNRMGNIVPYFLSFTIFLQIIDSLVGEVVFKNIVDRAPVVHVDRVY